MVFFMKYIVLFVKYCLFFVFQRIKTEIELYILLTFDQWNPYHMFFKYINQALVFPDFGVFLVDFLEDASFLRVFRIDVYIVFYDDVKGVLRDLYFQIERF